MLALIKEKHSKLLKGRGYRWHSLYRCSCGNEILRMPYLVLKGKVKSCGCMHYQSHGYLKHPVYKKYVGIMNRCYDKKNPRYKDYGGRGISVCDVWKGSPLVFVEWALNNGWESGLQIDRTNNDKGYSPDNCRFVTHTENIRNCRATKLSYKDVEKIRRRINTKELDASIALSYGVHYSTIARIRRGETWV